MIVDKYSNKIEFLYNTIKEYRDSFDTDTTSVEYVNYKTQELMDMLINHYNPLISIYINSNIVEYNSIQLLLEIANDYISLLSSKLHYIDNAFKDSVMIYNKTLLPLLLEINNSIDDKKESSDDITEKFTTPPYIDTYSTTFKNKCLELSHTTSLYQTSEHAVEVVKSNGIPGDFRRATNINGEIIFNAEDKITSHIQSVLDSKNHFEYEMLKIDNNVYKKISGKGLHYSEGISYINNDNKLYLEIKIILTRPIEINGFSFCDCQIDSDYIIRDVKVKNSIGVKYTVAKDVLSSGVNMFHFNLDTISEITMYIEQLEYNDCYIGHMYDTSVSNGGNTYSEIYNDVNIGSITNTGLTVSNGKITHPTNKSPKLNDNSIIRNLYSNDYARQLLLAKRFNISLYDFQLQNKVYRKNGYTILKYDFDNPIKYFSFNADEYFPNNDKETYIKYYASLDNENWHNIVPIYRTSVDEYNVISINDVITSTNLNIKTIFTNYQVQEIYLKIELCTSSESVSPIVRALYINTQMEGLN